MYYVICIDRSLHQTISYGQLNLEMLVAYIYFYFCFALNGSDLNVYSQDSYFSSVQTDLYNICQYMTIYYNIYST